RGATIRTRCCWSTSMGGMPCSPATLAPEAGGRRAAGTTERLGHELLAGDVRSGEPLKMTPCRSLLLDERLRSALEIRPSHAPRADRPRNEEGLFWRTRKRRRALLAEPETKKGSLRSPSE